MTVHLSARVAWHDDGWNGRICKDPAANTFCVGCSSYPGEVIGQKRDLAWERANAGEPCSKFDRAVPCCFSANAFGKDPIPAEIDPPDWFKGAKPRKWVVPASTVCVWPYEAMYDDDVRSPKGTYDHAKRLAKVHAFFDPVESGKSLVFYYANYSNPFSEDEARRYVLVGLSRVKEIGEQLFYEGCSEEVKERYAGGFVWQRAVTSHYPDQGLRIPYHKYRDRPEVLARLALFPDNPRLCKYASRPVSDDDALGLVEGFLRVVGVLQEIDDKTEDWKRRRAWLENLVGELWRHRGLLPGMRAVLESLGFSSAIPFFKERALAAGETEAAAALFAFLDGKAKSVPGLKVPQAEADAARRQWRLRGPEEQVMLREVLPRFDFDARQVTNLLSDKRSEVGITVDLPSLVANPYAMAEQYVGEDPDDLIPWSNIDRGMIPSPELGGLAPIAVDDVRRLRGLLVDALKRETEHTFAPGDRVLESVNQRLSVLPEWKRFDFTVRYLDADEEFLSGALQFRREAGRLHLYLRDAYEDERRIEKELSFLLGGPNIALRSPVTRETWNTYLYDAESVMARKGEKDYRRAIDRQIEACERVFVRPLSVLAGEAGTGKTTVIRALVKAIKKGHGVGASVIALAPTGKAADRIREILEADEGLKGAVEVATLHSFLAKRKWLSSKSLSFKRSGGDVEAGYSTYILDECSMLDLALAAAFFRSVRWSSVQRLILVGDPNQLPPIGRGRLFADILAHLESKAPENVARLEQNLRQTQGKLTGGGTGIIDLAQCFLHASLQEKKDESRTTAAEIMLQRVQEAGDVDKDLRVVIWDDQDDLTRTLVDLVEADMRADLVARGSQRGAGGGGKPYELWGAAFDKKPDYMQILTPYRGAFYGTEEINRVCQDRVQGEALAKGWALDGIAIFDKVIQIVNRPKSRPIKAYNFKTRGVESIEVFNGQLGFVNPHPFDGRKWMAPYFTIEHFSVSFARREDWSVGFGRGLGPGCPGESVDANLDLAYAISVHKAQGSDFERTYVVVPKSNMTLLTTELFYTALTRARRHCTLLLEKDISVLVAMRRREAAKLERINSSLFEFRAVPEELLQLRSWKEGGRIHRALADVMVRSKSEVIIANILHERDIGFLYEVPLQAPDGTIYLPDFTVTWRGTDFYWEHLGMLDRPDYRAHWEKKRAWYERFFPGRLIVTEESGNLSHEAAQVVEKHFPGRCA